MAKKQKIKLTAILVPIMAVLLALVIAASTLMPAYSTVMGDIFGRGEITITTTEGLDGNYYPEWMSKSTAESLSYAQAVTEEIVGEGSVLLQNRDNALPLGSGPKVTLLGYYSLHPNMSGGEDPRTTANAKPFDWGFQEAGIQVNPDVVAFYEGVQGEPALSEYPETLKDSFAQYGDAAVVVIKRNSGEGNDQTIMVAADNNRTGLSVSSTELDLLQYACDNFSKVIVVINSANAMELGFTEGGSYTDKYTGKTYDLTNLKAAIWCGGMGSQGTIAVGKIITGDITPSGHLVDTYVRDLTKDPTYQNFGSYAYVNSAEAQSYSDSSYFVEYEEGIYYGYKYYETAAYEAAQGNYAGFDYDTEVVYPFGYGLSYTTFDLAYEGTPSFDAATNLYTFKVKITNTGSAAGKGVAQIYVNVPYITGGVEKPHVLLVGYGKSEILQPGGSETVTITANRDYFTAYDYKNEKCYILDAGDYNFYLSDNAHSWTQIDKNDASRCWTETLGSKIVYNSGNVRPTDLSAAVNKFDDTLNWKFKEYTDNAPGSGYATNFTRANFKASFPTAPTGNDNVADSYVLSELRKYDATAASEQTVAEFPITDSTATSYQLIDMRGLDYDDERWDDYISQFSVSSMLNIFCNGGWELRADTDNGVPSSYDMDSPYGYYSFSNPPENINKWYQTAPVTAATFNVKLAEKLGDALAEEAQAQQYREGANTVITGIYGPGLNTHRSAFGGRNYEYFSEDAVLAGTMAAHEVSALSNKGMICYMKHFVLNEQETNRQNNGYACWTNEQALREAYMRSFEIYVKEATMTVNYYADTNGDGQLEMTQKEMPAANAIMTAYNRVGAVWAGAAETVNVLREEHGFVGISLTDAGGGANEYMNSDKGVRTGGTDVLLASNKALADSVSPTAIASLQRAMKNIMYNKANSNVMNHITPGGTISYGKAPWETGLLIGQIAVGVLEVAGIAALAFIWTRKENGGSANNDTKKK